VTAAAIVAAVLVASLAGSYWLVRHCRTSDRRRAQFIRDLGAQPTAVAREVDELELLLSLPAYDAALDAGCERLWDAIRDEQNKGEQ
jgi:hypothetical protein